MIIQPSKNYYDLKRNYKGSVVTSDTLKTLGDFTLKRKVGEHFSRDIKIRLVSDRRLKLAEKRLAIIEKIIVL